MLKVGDKVRVRCDLESDKWYGNDYFADSMNQYKGKVLTIKSMLDNGKFKLDGAEYWNWNKEMVVPFDFQEEPKTETNFEHYIYRIAICVGNNCDDYFGCGDECCNCPFGDTEKIKAWLLEPYKEESKIELTQFEHDLLTTIEDQRFNFNQRNMKMKELGYFKGVKDTKMRIKEILERSVIVDEK